MGIRTKDLSKIGYTDHATRSLAINLVKKHCKHITKEEIVELLTRILENPEEYKNFEDWGTLAEKLAPTLAISKFEVHDLLEEALPYKVYGGKYIESEARQQMDIAMRLPIVQAGALMPDAHMGYGLPIGGVLAVENAVIPYAVGVDIGCRMSLSIFDATADYLKRYSHQIKVALKEHTHFGMTDGISYQQEHEVLDRAEFRQTDLLRQLHGRAARQLGSSGGGNHFVEFGEISLIEDNVMGLPAGMYTALLSHSGSRGLGANIARHYCDVARQVCKLPREAQNLAWLGLDTEAGQEYWMAMNLAGDYSQANHERIHANLCKALGLKIIGNVNNHHNFAWEEEIAPNQFAIVHRKGATPAGKGVAGFIPGSMATAGYLVCGKGEADALNSASHGAGRAMSRSRAKSQFTSSAMKKMLQQAGVTLIGGSVEENPLAYKNIEEIMPAQQTLVDIHGQFIPRIVRMHKE